MAVPDPIACDRRAGRVHGMFSQDTAWQPACAVRPQAFCRAIRPVLFALVVATLLCLGLPVGPAGAEDAADVSKMGLDDLLRVKVLKVYGVSRYEQDAHEAPAQVTVVSADAIRRYDYRLLSDLLKSVAGLYVTDDRNYRYLGYRGFSQPGDYNTRVLLMIDGVRLNDDVYHQAPIGFDFPLDLRLVERVEIIRGPSQAIYGNNAFLLVVNVITKVPPGTALVETEATLDTRLGVSGRVTAGGPVSNSGAGLLLSGSLFGTPGSDVYLPQFDQPSNNNGVAHGCDFARGGSAFFKYNQAKLSLLGGYLQDTKGIPTGSWGTTFNDSASRTTDERFFADVSYHAIESPAGSLKLRSYLNAYNYEGSYAYPGLLSRDSSRSTTLGGEVVGNLVLPGENIVAAGVDYRHAFQVEQRESGGFYDNRTLDEVGLFVQDEFRPFQPLILTGSLRYDHLNEDLTSLSPKAAVVWLPTPELALKYLFGRSFRAPNAYERYYSADPYRANPSLKEEVMYSHELVAEYQMESDLRMSVTGFHYDYRSLINAFVDGDGFFRYRNLGGLRTSGIESELSFRHDVWSGGFSHTYQESSFTDASDGQVPNSPHHLVKLRVARRFLEQRVNLSGELQYTSRLHTLQPGTDVASYVVANLTLLLKNFLAAGLDATLAIKNLFDTSYTQPGGNEHLPVARIPQEGIGAELRLNYRF